MNAKRAWAFVVMLDQRTTCDARRASSKREAILALYSFQLEENALLRKSMLIVPLCGAS
jgi:hypothetical protein